MLMSFLNRILPFNKNYLTVVVCQSITVTYVWFNELSLGKFFSQMAKSGDPNAKVTASRFLPVLIRLVPQCGSQSRPERSAVTGVVPTGMLEMGVLGIAGLMQKATFLSSSHLN